MAKKIFITGATGFIGSNLARKMLGLGHEVHIIYRKSSDFWRIKDIKNKLRIHLCDITDEKKLKKVLKNVDPEIIFHLANIGVYEGTERDTEEVIKVNMQGTINLILAARDIPYKCFVNTGSSSEYGNKSKKMNEEDICKPDSVYALSKLGSTLYALQEFSKYKKPIVNLRLFTPYGPYDNASRLTSVVLRNSIEDRDILLRDKNTVRDYVFIDDVVEAYIKCMSKITIIKGEILNIGSGKEMKVEEVVKKILNTTRSKSKIIWGSNIPRRYESIKWQADIKKTKKLLNWSPSTDFITGIKITTKWYKNKKLLKN